MSKSSTRRKNQMWMSSNRVLSGNSKSRVVVVNNKKPPPHRNPNFETSETRLLISLWGDPKIQKTLITTHRKHPVIARLAEMMQAKGYIRTPEEINTRIKNLKCFYNRIKKDLDAGLIPYPTWKHYPAMDRIMTTPVFSVRPDEMPRPSLRFKMEPDSTASETRSEPSDDESFPHDLLTTELACDDDDEECDDGYIFTDKAMDIEVEEVVVPKEEPIEVDDEPEETDQDDRDVEDASDIFPKLSAYLQLASNHQSTASTTKPANNQIITTIAGTTTNPSEANTSLANAIKMGQSMVFTQQQSPQGKISLVPTNFLLKTQQPQIQLRQQPQHIIYNPGMTGNQSITTSAAGQMPNGMKVLLVNALQKGPVTAAANTPTDMQTKLITSNAIKASCITSSVPTTAEPRASSVESNKVKANASASSFRSLVSQLIEVQNQNLAVSRQRLEVERQRFDFEKSIAERIFAALPNIFLPQNDLTTMPLLKPKIEKED